MDEGKSVDQFSLTACQECWCHCFPISSLVIPRVKSVGAARYWNASQAIIYNVNFPGLAFADALDRSTGYGAGLHSGRTGFDARPGIFPASSS